MLPGGQLGRIVAMRATSCQADNEDLLCGPKGIDMNEIGRRITKAIDAGSIRSAAELARALGIQRSTVSRWLSGEKAPSADEARQLAGLLGLNAGALMAEAEAQRAKDNATRAEWLRVARLCQQTAKTTALSVLAAVVLYTTTPGTSHAGSSPYKPPSIHNADSQLSRRLRKALQHLARTARSWGVLRAA